MCAWKHTDSLSLKKIWQTNFAGMGMMNVFFDHKCVIYLHAIPPKITENGEYYVSILKFLWEYILRKHHDLRKKCMLHHNDAHLHVVTSVQQYLSNGNKLAFTVQISHHAISGCFQNSRKNSMAENLIQILKWFQQCRVFWSSFQKSLLYLFWKVFLNDETVAHHAGP